MTAERFTYYLQNPSHLYQISYQELKSLVVQYPYCQNLRYLLVTKSQIDNSEEYQKDLQLAATYSVDRNYLYHLVNKKEVTTSTSNSDSFVLNDDFLELKDISETSKEDNTTPIVLGSLAGASAGLVADNVEKPSATKTNDYVPYERRIKRIKRVNLNESSEIEVPKSSETKEPIDPIVDEIISSSIVENQPEIVEDDVPEIIESETIEEVKVVEIEEESKIKEDEIAENISDEPEMIAYMEKPKKRRSVIDQLLGRTPASDKNEKKEIPIVNEETQPSINAEDELESPQVEENPFMDLTPIKESTTYGREVLFEITNKTDIEMDKLLQRNQPEEEDTIEPNTTSMNENPEKNEADSTDESPSTPSPKTSFKSYLNQFQPPSSAIKNIEDEQEIANIIDETVEEVKNEVDMKLTEKKKGKKKKNKSKEGKEKLKAKSKKKGKEKKKKKSKALVKKVARQSIQENDDIFSETLAELLAAQGSRKKAIQMYKRLSLIFPKKSSFFAEKIKKLKK